MKGNNLPTEWQLATDRFATVRWTPLSNHHSNSLPTVNAEARQHSRYLQIDLNETLVVVQSPFALCVSLPTPSYKCLLLVQAHPRHLPQKHPVLSRANHFSFLVRTQISAKHSGVPLLCPRCTLAVYEGPVGGFTLPHMSLNNMHPPPECKDPGVCEM